MNTLVKVITRIGFKNNGESYLRLCHNADHVRYINYLSKRISDKTKTMNKGQLNSIINIRTCVQLTEKKQSSLETDLLIHEKQTSHADAVIQRYFPMIEKNYARKFLQSSRHYEKTLVQLNGKYTVVVTDEEASEILYKDWSAAETSELLDALRKLSFNFKYRDTAFVIDNEKCINIFDILNTKIPHLDDQNLEEALKCLIPLCHRFRMHLVKTTNLFDKECLQRMSKWNVDKLLLMCDIYFLLLLHNKSTFMWKAMGRLGSKPNRLTPKNLVQLLFLISTTRKGIINMYELEVCLEDKLDDLSINELGIAAMGFFKSKTKIRNSLLVKNIINRLIHEIEQVNSIALAALMKLIRFSMQYNEIVQFKMLLNKIISVTDSLDIMCLMHIGHCTAKACIFEESLVNIIIERMHKEINHVRIKDMERFVFMLSTFPIDNRHPIFDVILKEINERLTSNNIQEILKYPGVYLNLLYYLSVKDIYPIDILKISMSQVHMEKMSQHRPSFMGYNMFILEASVKIDRPEYNGPFLPENIYKSLIKRHWKEARHTMSSHMMKMFNEVIYVFKEHISSDVNLYIGRILPHYLQNDIVFGIDTNKNFVSAESILSQLDDFTPKKVDNTFPSNVKWVALLIIHYNHKIRGTNEPIGLTKARVRHLERIGYTPILISDDEWLRYQRLNEKGDYLKNLLKKI